MYLDKQPQLLFRNKRQPRLYWQNRSSFLYQKNKNRFLNDSKKFILKTLVFTKTDLPAGCSGCSDCSVPAGSSPHQSCVAAASTSSCCPPQRGWWTCSPVGRTLQKQARNVHFLHKKQRKFYSENCIPPPPLKFWETFIFPFTEMNLRVHVH